VYAKVFASLFDGSMRGRADMILVFVNMLSRCDKDGYDDRHQRAIADEVGLPIEAVINALRELESPDNESRTPTSEGKRIELIDPDNRKCGWFITNYTKYREIQDQESRRETFRKASKKYREKHKAVNISQHTSTSSQPISTEAEAEAEAEAEEDKKDILFVGKPDRPRIDYHKIINLCLLQWNELAADRPHLNTKKSISATLRKKMNTRIKEHPRIEEWADLLYKVEQSKVLGIHPDCAWFVFDWIFSSPQNYDKIMNGWMEWKAVDNKIDPEAADRLAINKIIDDANKKGERLMAEMEAENAK